MSDDSAVERESEDLIKVYMYGGKEAPPPSSGEADSKQLLEDDRMMREAEDADAIKPPYTPRLWAALMEKNTRLYRLIHAMAQNTVGLGWSVVPAVEITEDTPPEIRTLIAKQTETARDLFDTPNEDMPFPKLMKLEKVDEEATGNGFLEAVSNTLGVLTSLYHMPSHTVRVLRKGRGFVQIRNGKKRYFKNFGDDRIMDCETGAFGEAESIPTEKRASEVIQFAIYSPRSSYYGIPRYVCAAPAITGNRLAAVRNCAFFENDAVPRMAVIVSGGELSEKSHEHIEKFLKREGKGPDNSHRVLVIEAEPRKMTSGPRGQKPIDVRIEKLTVATTDDASFQRYREANDEEVREAFGIGAIFLGSVQDVNRASAMISRQVTNEQVFLPDIVDKEYVLNHKVLKRRVVQKREANREQLEQMYEQMVDKTTDGEPDIFSSLGIEKTWREKLVDLSKTLEEKSGWVIEEYDEGSAILSTKLLVKLRFERPKTVDPVDTSRADRMYSEQGAYTPNELRAKLGLPPFPQAFTWANKPFELAKMELQAQLDKEAGQGEGSQSEGGQPGTSASFLIGELLALRKALRTRVVQEEEPEPVGAGVAEGEFD